MTTKISKSLMESISNVVNSDSKNLTESYSYIDKKNNKASNTDQLEDLIAAELDLGGVDDEDLETMLDLFKKGYYIAVAVGAGTKRELKKDGYTLGNFAAYKDGDERTQEIYVKAPAGMKEEMTEAEGSGNKLKLGYWHLKDSSGKSHKLSVFVTQEPNRSDYKTIRIQVLDYHNLKGSGSRPAYITVPSKDVDVSDTEVTPPWSN